ncbi:hypothetical protein [Haloarchaeobius sp. DFWS5]|uniref:hypothetical protein n=1 Tax=Haloarchaeobius sp. DFWS5 TaxID=3446114 RepID=UPI003EB75E70
MLESQYVLVFLLACATTYFAFYRYELHVVVNLLVAVFCWGTLVVVSGSVRVASNGTKLSFGSPLMQALSVFMLLVCGFALVFAIFGEFPNDSMLQDTNETE